MESINRILLLTKFIVTLLTPVFFNLLNEYNNESIVGPPILLMANNIFSSKEKYIYYFKFKFQSLLSVNYTIPGLALLRIEVSNII